MRAEGQVTWENGVHLSDSTFRSTARAVEGSDDEDDGRNRKSDGECAVVAQGVETGGEESDGLSDLPEVTILLLPFLSGKTFPASQHPMGSRSAAAWDVRVWAPSLIGIEPKSMQFINFWLHSTCPA